MAGRTLSVSWKKPEKTSIENYVIEHNVPGEISPIEVPGTSSKYTFEGVPIGEYVVSIYGLDKFGNHSPAITRRVEVLNDFAAEIPRLPGKVPFGGTTTTSVLLDGSTFRFKNVEYTFKPVHPAGKILNNSSTDPDTFSQDISNMEPLGTAPARSGTDYEAALKNFYYILYQADDATDPLKLIRYKFPQGREGFLSDVGFWYDAGTGNTAAQDSFVAITGTAIKPKNSSELVGTGTSFETDLKVGDILKSAVTTTVSFVANGVSVNDNTNRITIENSGLVAGDKVVYNKGSDTVINGLTNYATYYIGAISGDSFKLYSVKADALSGNNSHVDIYSTTWSNVHDKNQYFEVEREHNYLGRVNHIESDTVVHLDNISNPRELTIGLIKRQSLRINYISDSVIAELYKLDGDGNPDTYHMDSLIVSDSNISLENAPNTSSLVHYFPCNSIVGGAITDIQGGVSGTILGNANNYEINSDSVSGNSLDLAGNVGVELLTDSEADTWMSDTWTASIWAKSESENETVTDQSTKSRILSRDRSDFFALMFAQNSTQQPSLDFRTSSGLETLTLDTEFSVNEWHHYAIVYDGTNLRIYVDGLQKASTTNFSKGTSSRPLGIGSNVEGSVESSDHNFVGKISEIKLFNTSLNHTEVMGLYQQPSVGNNTGTSDEGIKLGSGNQSLNVDSNGIYLGAGNLGDSPFSVNPGGAIHAVSGKIANWKLSESSIYSGNSPTMSGYATAGISINSNGSISTPQFFVDQYGDASFAGELSATTGDIGGWQLAEGGFSIGGFDSDGYTTGGITFSSADGGSIHAKQFYIDTDGNANFKGNITGATGEFNGSVQIGSGDSVFTADSNGIYLGDETFANAEFSVTPAGNLVAQTATVTGTIYGNKFSTLAGQPAQEVNTGTKIQSQAILSPRVVMRGDRQVTYAVLEDETRVYHNNEILGIFNKGHVGTIDATDLSSGDILHSSRPTSFKEAGRPVPALSATGTMFMGYSSRQDYQHFHVYAPYSDGTLKYAVRSDKFPTDIDWTDSTKYSTLSLTEGSVSNIAYNSGADAGKYYWFLSDTPVVMIQASSDSSTPTTGPNDARLLKAASREIIYYGTNTQVTTFSGATESSAGVETKTNNTWSYSRAPETLLSAAKIGDGAGTDGTYGMPWNMCGDTYIIDHALKNYQIASVEPTIVTSYYWDGNSWELYKSHDLSEANRDNLLGHKEGTGDSEGAGTDAERISNSDGPWRFIGTGRFALRTNDVNDDEYMAIGYDSNLRSQETIRVGQLIAEDLSVGVINSDHIDSLTINANHLQSDSITGTKISASTTIAAFSRDSNGNVISNTYAALDGIDSEYRIYAGSESPGNAPFAVAKDGTVEARSIKLYDANGQLYFDSNSGFGFAALTQIAQYLTGRVYSFSVPLQSDYVVNNVNTYESVTLLDSGTTGVTTKVKLPIQSFGSTGFVSHYSTPEHPLVINVDLGGSPYTFDEGDLMYPQYVGRHSIGYNNYLSRDLQAGEWVRVDVQNVPAGTRLKNVTAAKYYLNVMDEPETVPASGLELGSNSYFFKYSVLLKLNNSGTFSFDIDVPGASDYSFDASSAIVSKPDALNAAIDRIPSSIGLKLNRRTSLGGSKTRLIGSDNSFFNFTRYTGSGTPSASQFKLSTTKSFTDWRGDLVNIEVVKGEGAVDSEGFLVKSAGEENLAGGTYYYDTELFTQYSGNVSNRILMSKRIFEVSVDSEDSDGFLIDFEGSAQQDSALLDETDFGDGVIKCIIRADEINANHIQTGSLVADLIDADTINANHVNADTIVADLLNADKVNANHVAATSIVAELLNADTINANHVQADTIVACLLKATTIEACHIKAGSIMADIMSADEINANHIQAGSVVADVMEANTIHACNITATTLSAVTADLGAITAGTLQNSGVNAIPDANAAPTGAEKGAFIDLTAGKFVFGSASKHILWDGTDLTLSGVAIDAASTIDAIAGVTVEHDGVLSNCAATLLDFTTGLDVVTTSKSSLISVNTNVIATVSYVDTEVSTAVSNLVDSAPDALDTLNELAAALNDDASFSDTMSSVLAGKVAKTSVQALDAADPLSFTESSGVLTLKRGDGTTDTVTIPDTTYSIDVPSGSTKIKLTGLDNVHSEVNIVGSGDTTVTRDSASSLTISSHNIVKTAGTGLAITGTEIAISSSVLTTTDNQSISGVKTFTSGIKLSANNSLQFEGGKHLISYNDGRGNFNIRVGTDDEEFVKEAGYVFHDEWSQASGWRAFYISGSSQLVNQQQGDHFTWREQLKYDKNSVYLRYQGSTKLTTSASGITVTGNVNGRNLVTDGTKLDGIDEEANKYVLPSASSTHLGGIKLGYEASDKNYPLLKDANDRGYVSVNWDDANDGTITIVGGTYLGNSLVNTFSLNDSANTEITLNHDSTTRTDTTSANTASYSGTFEVIDSISSNATGHITAVNVKTMTMPAEPDETTYDLSVPNQTTKIRLAGSDSTEDDITFVGGGKVTVTNSNTNEITISGADTVYTAGDGLNLDSENQFSVHESVVRTASSQTIGGEKTFSNRMRTGNIIYTSNSSLQINSSTNGSGARISFSDHYPESGDRQFGYIRFNHEDSKSYGADAVFTLEGENNTALRVMGRILMNDGLYGGSASAGHAGTRLLSDTGIFDFAGGTMDGHVTITNGGETNTVLNLNGSAATFLEKDTGTEFYIANNVNNKDIILRVNSGNTNVEALRLSAANDGKATFSNAVSASSFQVLGTTVIDADRDIHAVNSYASGFTDFTGLVHHRNNIKVLNPAGNGWVTWFERNSGAPNLKDLNDITLGGTLTGPATFTIQPSTSTGTVVIAGNLQVSGSTTTINSSALQIDDINITVAKGSTNKANANLAGLTVDCGTDTDATFDYTSSNDSWNMNKDLRIATGGGTGTFEVGRDTSQYIRLEVSDHNNTITASQDADSGQESGSDHSFILNRTFLGDSANDFKIQKGGTDQLTIDKNGVIRLYGNLTTSSLIAGRNIETDGTKLDTIDTNANNYSLPIASSGTLGGVQLGYVDNNKNYALELSGSSRGFVNVPWTDNFVNSASLVSGTLTLGRTGTLADLTVDLDSRYFSETESDERYFRKDYNTNYTRLGYGSHEVDGETQGQAHWHKLADITVTNNYTDYHLSAIWTSRFSKGTLYLHVHSDANTTPAIYNATISQEMTNTSYKKDADHFKYKTNGSVVEVWVYTPMWHEFDYIRTDSIGEATPTRTWYKQGDTGASKQTSEPSGLTSFTDVSVYKSVPSNALFTDTTYTIATSTTAGLFKIGYTDSEKNYAVELDGADKAYVNVPWTGGLTSISKSNNTLIFAADGADDVEYTFGSNAFNSTTIPAAANNTEITLSGGTGITTSIGSFTTNQSSTETLTISTDLSEFTSVESMSGADEFVTLIGGAERKISGSNVKLTMFDATDFKASASGGNASQLNGQDASYYLNTSTSFSGAVSGVYNALTLGTQSDITMTGTLKGPASFTIDPADDNGDHGNNNGTVVIKGNLQIDGTTTTINSSTLDVDDLNITVAKGAANAAAANGAGLTVDGANATLEYTNTHDRWEFNKNVYLGSGTFRAGAGTENNAGSFRAFHTDGSYSNLYGYGLVSDRSNFYIRPTVTDSQYLRIGGADNTKDWQEITVRSNAGTSFIKYITDDEFVYPITVAAEDPSNSTNQTANASGVGIQLKICSQCTAAVGASIVAVREEGQDENTSTGLAFHVSQNDEVLDEAIRIKNNKYVGIGTNDPGRQLELKGQGVIRLNGTDTDPGIDFQTDGTNDMQFRYRHDSDYLGVYSYGTTSDVVSIKKSNGFVGIGTTNPVTKLQVEEYGVDTMTTAVSTTTETVIDTIPKALFRTLKYTVQITQGTNYQASEVLVLHDGTTAIATEFAKLETNGVLGTINTDISGDNIRLKVTMSSADAATVKIVRHSVTV